MSDKPWKAFERMGAKWFGTVRNPLSGRNSKVTASDSRHPVLFIEAKRHKKIAVISLWKKTAMFAKKERKIPVVLLKPPGENGFWILVKEKDLIRVALERIRARKRERLERQKENEDGRSEEDKELEGQGFLYVPVKRKGTKKGSFFPKYNK